VSRLSPDEILMHLETQTWVDAMRQCGVNGNNTAYHHLIPVLLLEGATLRKELSDLFQMLKGLTIATSSKDCRVFDTVEYDVSLFSQKKNIDHFLVSLLPFAY
jgi:hypothetical protein